MTREGNLRMRFLVLFFVIGQFMKTCGSFTELKRPEVAFKGFIRFVLAPGGGHLRHGADDGSVLDCAGHDPDDHGRVRSFGKEASTLPAEIASTIEDVGLLEMHSPLGGDAARFAVYLGAVARDDSDRLWPLF